VQKYQYCRFRAPISNTVNMEVRGQGRTSAVKIRWGIQRVPWGSDLRKIITQIKTTRNIARVVLDYLSHNFWPKSRPVKVFYEDPVESPVDIMELLISFFLIWDEKSCNFSINYFPNTYIIISRYFFNSSNNIIITQMV